MANLKLNYADGFSETKSMNTVGSFNIVLTADDISWDLSKAHSLAAKIGNASGYLTDLRINLDDIEDKSQGTISIKLDDQFMADFPPDLYFLEVWADTDDGRLIFPSDGGSALTFTINRNIMSNFEGVAKVTLVQFQEDFNELKKIIQKNQAFLDVSLKDSLNYSNDLSKKYEDLNQHGRDQLETDLSNARQNIEDKKSDAHSYVDKVNSDSTNDIQSKVDNAKSYIDNNTDKNTKAVDNTVSKAKSDLANYSSDRQNDVNNTVNSAKSDLTSFSQARQNEINDRVNQLKQTINTQKAQYENDVGNIKNDFEYQKGTYADLRDETRNLLQQLEANEGKVHASVEDIQDARFGAQTKADNAQNQAVQQSANYTNQKYDELNNKNNILSSRIDGLSQYHNSGSISNGYGLDGYSWNGSFVLRGVDLSTLNGNEGLPLSYTSFWGVLKVETMGGFTRQYLYDNLGMEWYRYLGNGSTWKQVATDDDLQNKTNDLSQKIDSTSKDTNLRIDTINEHIPGDVNTTGGTNSGIVNLVDGSKNYSIGTNATSTLKDDSGNSISFFAEQGKTYYMSANVFAPSGIKIGLNYNVTETKKSIDADIDYSKTGTVNKNDQYSFATNASNGKQQIMSFTGSGRTVYPTIITSQSYQDNHIEKLLVTQTDNYVPYDQVSSSTPSKLLASQNYVNNKTDNLSSRINDTNNKISGSINTAINQANQTTNQLAQKVDNKVQDNRNGSINVNNNTYNVNRPLDPCDLNNVTTPGTYVATGLLNQYKNIPNGIWSVVGFTLVVYGNGNDVGQEIVIPSSTPLTRNRGWGTWYGWNQMATSDDLARLSKNSWRELETNNSGFNGLVVCKPNFNNNTVTLFGSLYVSKFYSPSSVNEVIVNASKQDFKFNGSVAGNVSVMIAGYSTSYVYPIFTGKNEDGLHLTFNSGLTNGFIGQKIVLSDIQLPITPK